MRWIWVYSVDGVDDRNRPTKKSLSCETSNHGGIRTYVRFIAPKGYVYGGCMCLSQQ